jgi:hypothetical protein
MSLMCWPFGREAAHTTDNQRPLKPGAGARLAGGLMSLGERTRAVSECGHR